jgi:hypothetical protein
MFACAIAPSLAAAKANASIAQRSGFRRWRDSSADGAGVAGAISGESASPEVAELLGAGSSVMQVDAPVLLSMTISWNDPPFGSLAGTGDGAVDDRQRCGSANRLAIRARSQPWIRKIPPGGACCIS